MGTCRSDGKSRSVRNEAFSPYLVLHGQFQCDTLRFSVHLSSHQTSFASMEDNNASDAVQSVKLCEGDTTLSLGA